jgi:hypothetical protein
MEIKDNEEKTYKNDENNQETETGERSGSEQQNRDNYNEGD